MDDDKYVIVDHPTGKEVRPGPGVTGWFIASGTKHNKIRLTDTQYIKVTHLNATNDHGAVEIVSGPLLYAPTDAYATLSGVQNKTQLTAKQYVKVTDSATGQVKIVSGPTMYTPGPYEELSATSDKVKMSATQYVVILDEQSGTKSVQRGPQTFTPGPFDKFVPNEVLNMTVLNNTDYVYLTDTTTGNISIVEGPTTVAPGPYDKVSDVKKKIVLKNNEYVKIVDDNDGKIRVERGPATVILQPYESQQGNKTIAHEVNEHRAVYVFNTDSGKYDLITKHQMFFPSPTQVVQETRDKIRLEEHEVLVLVDKDGRYSIVDGKTDGRAFFVPPYCNILTQDWSTDIEKEHKSTTKVSRFDTRPQYMDFEFLIRTRDNVEIYLDLNFYWQIMDVHKMILQTQDPPADICKHAQSQILGLISRVDMKEFMESFNEIIQSATKGKNDEFYNSRGVALLRVEITGRRCKDPVTEQNFQEIIKEKTDRIKNLEKQQGENEIRMCKLDGDKKAEEMNGELVSIKRKYMREEATADGESEADRITKFFANLPEDMSDSDKMAIYMEEKKKARLELLVTHVPNLIVKPEDVEFQILQVDYNGKDSKVKAPQLTINPNQSKKSKKTE